MLRTTAIAKELAAIERKMQETDNATLKEALKKKQARLKAELKDPGQSATKLAKTLLAQREVVKQLSKVEFNDLIRRLSKKPEYAFLKTMPKSTVKNDLEVTAKPVGWRFKGRGNYDKPTKAEIIKGKKNGTVYREVRPRRSDVSQVVKLAEGGSIEVINKMPEGYKKISYDEVKDLKIGQKVSFAYYVYSTNIHLVKGKIIRINNNSDNKYKWTIRIDDGEGGYSYNVKDIYTKTGKMSHGGSMYAEGGSLEQESVEMINNQATSAKHHIEELKKVLSHQKEIEPWVIAKMQRATTDLADITHYLDGKDPKMAFGGVVYDLSNDAIDRMDGLAPIDAMQVLNNNILEISKSLEEEGFEKEEIASYLSYKIVEHLNKMMKKSDGVMNKNSIAHSILRIAEDYEYEPQIFTNSDDSLTAMFRNLKLDLNDPMIIEMQDELSSLGYSYNFHEKADGALYLDVEKSKMAIGGKIGSTVVFKNFQGDIKEGEIIDFVGNRGYEVRSGYGTAFVKPDEVITIKDQMMHGGSIEVGDKVKASKEYGGKSGKVVEKRGSFVVVEDSKGNTESYHESDLIKKMKEGGEIGYYTYEGESIMFEPYFKEYYVGDAGPFNTLDEAKEYIDGGSQTPDSIKDAYRKGLFAKGGQLTAAQQKKFDKVMHEWGQGKLHSGSEDGPIVKDQDQAIAIAYAEARGMKKMHYGGSMYAEGGSMGWKHKMKNGGYTGFKCIDPRVKELTDKLSRDNKNDVVKVVIDYHQDKNEKQTIDKLRDLGAKYSIKNDNETARNIAEIATIIMKHKMK